MYNIFECIKKVRKEKKAHNNCVIMFLQNVLQESTVKTATYLVAPCAKVQQNVIAIRASASVGAKEGGLEKNAIKVVVHSLTLSEAYCS